MEKEHESGHQTRVHTSGMASMTCPLAMTSAGTPVAAMAEHTAYLGREGQHLFQILNLESVKIGVQLTCCIKFVKNTDQLW